MLCFVLLCIYAYAWAQLNWLNVQLWCKNFSSTSSLWLLFVVVGVYHLKWNAIWTCSSAHVFVLSLYIFRVSCIRWVYHFVVVVHTQCMMWAHKYSKFTSYRHYVLSCHFHIWIVAKIHSHNFLVHALKTFANT